MNSSSIDTGREVAMFDALLALSQHIRLLVLGPLIVASLVLGAMMALPPVFNSQAILILPKPAVTEIGWLGSSASTNALTPAQVATVMKSAVVLDPVFLAVNPGAGNPDDKAREALAASIKTSVTKDGLLRVEVTAATALEAQKIANSLIDAWLRTTKPTLQLQVELEKRLAHARQNLLTTQTILASQKTSLLSLAGLGELLDRYFDQTLEIERQMKGLTRDVIVQLPTLPSKPVSQAHLVVFLQVAFGAELLLVIWVLGRRALESAKEDPETAKKLEKLRGSVRGLESGKNSDTERLNRVDSA